MPGQILFGRGARSHILRWAAFAPGFLTAWFAFGSARTQAQTSDVTPPSLVSFSFTPNAIDVTAGEQSVTATLHVTDNLSGVSVVTVNFRSPTFAQSNFAQSFSPVTGTRLDGTHTVTVRFPQFSEAGLWLVSSVIATDLAGNQTVVSTATLQALGSPTQLSVVSTPDGNAPQVASIAIAPAAVDVSTTSATFTVTLNVLDDLSGATFMASCAPGTFGSFFAVTVRSPSGAQNRFISGRDITLISGNSINGIWQGAFPMPRYSEPGTWSVLALQLRDCAGNNRFHTTASLMALGLPITFQVTSTPADVQPPTLTSLSFQPITINTATGSQSVRVQLGISDALAGADFSQTTPQQSFFERGIQFRSPSGTQIRLAAIFSPFTLISGTAFNGVWEGVVGFPQFSEDGTWRIDLLQIKDAVRNISSFNTASLQALGFPTTLEVIRPSLISDGTVGTGGGTVMDDTFGDRASITIPAGALGGITDVAIDVLSDPLQIPNPTGFTGPGTPFVNIELTPSPNFPLPPPGMQIVLPLSDPLVPGTLLNLYKVDAVTGGLVPAVDVFGNPAAGTVAPDGLSVVFDGVSGLSTVVGLIPEAIAVGVDIRPGTFPNTVNLGSRGVLPVAILSTDSFDARSVLPESVRLAGAGARQRPNGEAIVALQDVNGDGRIDMLLQIEIAALQLLSEDTQALLDGMTTAGMVIRGSDSIRIVR